jgi:mono/diheme cytochrome c family protein
MVRKLKFPLLRAAVIVALVQPLLSCLGQTAATPLAWDAPARTKTLAAGETSVRFVFAMTNVSAAEVALQRVTTSCGCTVAQLPSLPWRLAPGEQGDLKFTMDLRGRRGSITKTATVFTSSGASVLTMTMTATVPGALTSAPQPASARIAAPSRPDAAPGTQPAISNERARNQALARADHQSVFRGDCAKCHAEPAKGKLGKELYAAACGICHDAKHRAEMVPALGQAEQAGNPGYWNA